jgi:hypothetical protein
MDDAKATLILVYMERRVASNPNILPLEFRTEPAVCSAAGDRV